MNTIPNECHESLKKLAILHREEGTYPDIIDTHVILFSTLVSRQMFSRITYNMGIWCFTFNMQDATSATNSRFLISKILLSHFCLAVVWLRGLKNMEDKVFTPISNEVESCTMIERGM